jgi:hypothetical protein
MPCSTRPPARQRFVDLELTDAKGAEGFERFPVLPGEIRIGDRGYISCGGLRHVLDGGGDFLIRAGWNAFRLRQLITSLDGVAADDILALYRLRRQIELAFKRLKPLAGLDRLPARGAPLARAWIAAKLIIATLIGLTIEEFLDTPGVGAAIDKRPPSIWCVFHLALKQIIHLAWRVDPYPNFALAGPALRRHLCDSPRKRRKQLSLAFTFR